MSNDTIAMSRAQTRNDAKRRRFLQLPRWVLLALAAVFLATIGSIYAWSMREADQENILQSHNTGVRIDETLDSSNTVAPGATRTKKVAFTNTGSSAVFLGVAYNESWYYNQAWFESDGSQATKNWASAFTSEWVLKSDGWYYYNKVLPTGATTAAILNSVTFPSNLQTPYNAADYSLDFMVEAVQLSDEAGVNNQATQTVFGRTATVTIGSTLHGAVTSGTVSWS